jgi:hypothetical protein
MFAKNMNIAEFDADLWQSIQGERTRNDFL